MSVNVGECGMAKDLGDPGGGRRRALNTGPQTATCRYIVDTESPVYLSLKVFFSPGQSM